VALLRAFVSDATLPVDAAEMLSDAERHRILFEFNDTGEPDYDAASLVGLIEQQVDAAPGAIAVETADAKLTYAQLDARANQLAHHLRSRGVVPGDRVGVCLRRTVDLPVAIFGILKAGAAYVPLDPGYPTARLAYMLENSEARLVVSSTDAVTTLGDGVDAVLIDRDANARAIRPHSRLDLDIGLDDLAYVMYTSGSTGQPKGVALSHRSVVALAGWFARHCRDALQNGLLSTSLCFDLSVTELFAPLACGGRVLLIDNLLALPSSPLAEEVTFMQAVPSVMKRLLEIGTLPRNVKLVIMGGEPVPGSLAQAGYQHGADDVWDMYGPTETTVWSSVWPVPRGDASPLPIGRPLNGERVYILDARGNPTPIGVPGEAYIAGVGLARGYLNRPDLTDERFVADPFVDDPTARMYRTGDLCRFRRDGVIECLGRLDH